MITEIMVNFTVPGPYKRIGTNILTIFHIAFNGDIINRCDISYLLQYHLRCGIPGGLMAWRRLTLRLVARFTNMDMWIHVPSV